MKFKHLTILPILFCQLTVSAQSEIKSGNEAITYDFLGKNNLPSNFQIRKEAKVHFIINNINRSLYTISVNNTDKSWYGSKPAIFNVLTNVDVSKIDSALITAQKNTGLAEHRIFDEGEVNPELKTLSTAFREKRASVTGYISTYPQHYKTLKDYEEHYRTMNNLLLDYTHTFKQIDSAKLSLTSIFLKTVQNYNGKDDIAMGLKLLSGATAKIKTLLDDYDEIYKRNESLKLMKPLYLEKLSTELVKKKADLMKKKSKEDQTAIKATLIKIESELKQVPELALIIEESINEIKPVKANVEALKQADFPNTLKSAYDKINESNWTYISPSFTAKKDAMEIKFSVEPKDPLVSSANYANYNTEITGFVTGFKINFSSGLFLLQGKRLFDQSYRTETITGDAENNKVIQNNNKSRIAPAIGALMHFYHQGTSSFNVGGAFGLSVNNETNLAYHGGISLLFGKEQRLVLSGGLSLAKVKLISDMYEVDGMIPKSVTTIPTSNYYKWGTFLSFTYNLSTL